MWAVRAAGMTPRRGRSSKAGWALVLWVSEGKDVMGARCLLVLAIILASSKEGETTPPRDSSLSFVLGGSWFQRSERGQSGNYLTLDFKVSKPFIYRIMRKDLFFWVEGCWTFESRDGLQDLSKSSGNKWSTVYDHWNLCFGWIYPHCPSFKQIWLQIQIPTHPTAHAGKHGWLK